MKKGNPKGKKRKQRRIKKKKSPTACQGKGQHLRTRTVEKQNFLPELLAPAGSMDSFHAAIDAGADAVYAGAGRLNARSYGSNFSLWDIEEMLSIAHAADKKLFIALNSLVKEDELKSVLELLAGLDMIGVDALIIQDLGVLKICRDHFPDLRLHASTLMGIHNQTGTETAAALGFSRAVLARELTLQEIRRIAAASSIETEIFIHGALCFSISGLCLFSSFHGGKSSMRGRCVQPCRRRYRWGEREGAWFSMSDLCGLELVSQLKNSGVTSFKIEGRLKPAEYVYSVVKAYRMVMDCNDATQEQELLAQAMAMVKNAGGRHLSTGFLSDPKGTGGISPGRASAAGIYLGTGDIVSTQQKISMELNLRKGSSLEPGDRIRMVLPWCDIQHNAKIVSRKPVSGSPLRIVVEPAPDQEFLQQVNRHRNGKILFYRTSSRPLAARISSGKDINILSMDRSRRSMLTEEAGEKAREIWHIMAGRQNTPYVGASRGESYQLLIRVSDLSQAAELAAQKGVQIAGFLIPLNAKNIREFSSMRRIRIHRDQVIWAIDPVIYPDRVPWTKRTIRGLIEQGHFQFQVSNIGHLALFPRPDHRRRRHDLKLPILYGSYQLNLLNSCAIEAARQMGIRQPCISIETDMENIRALRRRYHGALLLQGFGFIPLFTSRVNHRIYGQNRQVISSRGEKQWWRYQGDTGLLHSDRPYSALGLYKELFQLGLTTWIMDLDHLPEGYRLPRRFPKGLSRLSSTFKGSHFNLATRLE